MTPRESIDLPGFGHENPIPVASRRGPFVFSGALTGRDPETGELPATLDEQVANVFRHVRALVAAVGGTTDDIIKMTVWLVDYRDRTALNREWIEIFPDPSSRPARHVVRADLDSGVLVQADVTAILGED
ncbi:RidA family protein [Microbacterium immunditiarum]|uniref:Enamine deaminase RidA (YjgF/YER057c/UK114 family) n=1 Tax=Microbacterium immunditiarum TaxID=337480 RepID=A0A7Y9GRS8_9MICO|nr:RidA family protein [Microbacterium immunditiarum]NYE21497.1 enamine deaminase RidA (YjgF/YER057c/UK114 family) [Microbacterium immunditiarum]